MLHELSTGELVVLGIVSISISRKSRVTFLLINVRYAGIILNIYFWTRFTMKDARWNYDTGAAPPRFICVALRCYIYLVLLWGSASVFYIPWSYALYPCVYRPRTHTHTSSSAHVSKYAILSRVVRFHTHTDTFTLSGKPHPNITRNPCLNSSSKSKAIIKPSIMNDFCVSFLAGIVRPVSVLIHIKGDKNSNPSSSCFFNDTTWKIKNEPKYALSYSLSVSKNDFTIMDSEAFRNSNWPGSLW